MGAVSVDQRAPLGPLPVGAKLGRYEILAKLAAGGMAIVYVARAHGVAGFERLVAIKVLHSNLAHEEEFIKMFLDEARLAASIRHPNVVPTIDISDSEKSGYFIVMEYIEGDHLGQLLSSATKTGEKIPVPVVLRIICDALGGLGAAHDLVDEHGKPQNLVHRDVSPHNIMVGRDGVARLTDFGVAKAEDRLTHTRDGQVKGKLAYMAPEQAASGTTDTRSDLFSMGVILWEGLTGQRLLRAESTAATLHKLLHAEIRKPSTVDPALAPLDPVLEKALARDPAQRFQTAEEFARALEDVAGSFAGVASLREVGRVVRHYAAIKLKRDKKQIDEAIRALRPPDSVGHGMGEGMVAADETSSPTSPSSSDISIVAGASPSIISKVTNGILANDTMPGTRRGRRTAEIALQQQAKSVPPPPLGAAAGAKLAPPLTPTRPVPAVSLTAPADPRVRTRTPTSVEAIPPIVIDVELSAAFESAHKTLETVDPFAGRARARAGIAMVAAGVLALVALAFWGGSSQENVRVQQMDASAAPLRVSAAPTVLPNPEPATAAATVVPLAPRTTTERAERSGTPAAPSVNVAPAAPQVISPVVPSAEASAPRTPARNTRTAARPRREASAAHDRTRAAARPMDVMPNPYHD